ncbi:MAG TPA: patatin-like phospholipase family protein [Clostridia bacterium]|nr:patatin-like phospholipase family protein [Clostridia bacterium]
MNPFSKFARSFRAFTTELNRRPAPSLPAPYQRPKLGLALGGGFARGIAHIGVLKVLEEEGIPVDFVAGTSVGAIIGAAYCSGVSARQLEEISSLVRFRDFARWTLSRYGFCNNDRMETFLSRIVRAKTFEELKTPLAIAATDFITGEGVVFRSGPLLGPARASCAYPGMFLPVELDGRMLVDGMLAHAVPTLPLRDMGADRVIGVYLSAHWVQLRGPRHLFDVIGQCFSIAQARMTGYWKAYADLVLEPNVDGFSYDAFDRSGELISVGEECMRQALPGIRKWMEEPPQALPQLARGTKAGSVPAPAA